MQVRCPHCHNPIEMVLEDPSSDVSCPSCGSCFNLAKDGETLTTDGPPAKMLGHFQLLHCLGQGAFGTVWKARDTELDRIVAIKIPRKENLTEADAEKFLREARAAAQVRHPNIVSVHEVGSEDGRIYIASDFIDGASLDEWVQAHPLTVRESVELCAKIAEALHHAHEAGVVHRDLKPQNILVRRDEGLGARGESAAGGQVAAASNSPLAPNPSPLRPFITDFGLAKRDAGEITMTIEGAILGTPAYMPPEQARGEAHHADRRSDVYSLGVILFRLLTGELPFRGQRQMLIVQILNEEPPALRKLDARLPRDVETICLKCLEKDHTRRYQSAADLAADLRRWLTGHPIQARPVSRTERAWRWCQRNATVAALIASVMLVLLIGIAISWFFAAQSSRRANDLASANTRISRQSEKIGEQNVSLEQANHQLIEANGALKQSVASERLAKAEAEANALLAREQSEHELQTLERVILSIERQLKDVAGGATLQRELLNDVRRSYQKAVENSQKLPGANPNNDQGRRALTVLYKRIGDEQLESGRLAEALRSFEKDVEWGQKLVASNSADRQAQRHLSVSYSKLGDVQLQSGNLVDASRSYEKSLEIIQKLASTDSTDADRQRDLSIAHERLGDAQLETGQLAEALRSYQQAMEISQKLSAAEPSDVQSQRDLSLSYEKLGSVQLRAGNTKEALTSYGQAHLNRLRLSRAAPEDSRALRDLFISSHKLGEIMSQTGQANSAERVYLAALQTIQRLAAKDPTDVGIQRDLSIAYEKLGDVQLQRGHLDEAGFEAASFTSDSLTGWQQQSLAIRQRLLAADPTNVQAQRDLWVSFYKLGEAERKEKHYDKAIVYYQKAFETVKAMQQSGSLAPQDKDTLKLLEDLIQQCRHSAQEE